MTLEAGLTWRQALAEAGRSVVLTNGHFDLLHVGHARDLQAAAGLGEALIVGLNSDALTWGKPGRPIVPQDERAESAAALGCVDVVVIFDDLTANVLVAVLRPDIYAKGGDWSRPDGPRPPEAEIVAGYGGRVIFLPYLPERSTTALIEKIADVGQRTWPNAPPLSRTGLDRAIPLLPQASAEAPLDLHPSRGDAQTGSRLATSASIVGLGNIASRVFGFDARPSSLFYFGSQGSERL